MLSLLEKIVNKEGVYIHIQGDFTCDTVRLLQKDGQMYLENLHGAINKLIFNFSQVQLVDGTGLEYLMKIDDLLEARDCTLELHEVPKDILNILELVGLDKHLKMIPCMS